jgi:hypothetical protein
MESDETRSLRPAIFEVAAVVNADRLYAERCCTVSMIGHCCCCTICRWAMVTVFYLLLTSMVCHWQVQGVCQSRSVATPRIHEQSRMNRVMGHLLGNCNCFSVAALTRLFNQEGREDLHLCLFAERCPRQDDMIHDASWVWLGHELL